ncbi:MAG: xanthine dehydrogenase family protein subunit M [Burkholderiales bacterium]|nr:xanthine dehydrogenase family protein subunit M [Burkholderiales bacterium]
MRPLVYRRAASLAEAERLLAEHPAATLLAGGMTLIPTLKLRLARPSHVVDIARLAELRGIDGKDGRLTVGAATTHAEVAGAVAVRRAIPALAELAAGIGDPQVRNAGTLGGSVANNDPAADYPAAVLALDATIETNRRTIPAAEFLVGMFATALAPGEIVLRVGFAMPERAAYRKFAHPASGYAMAGVFVAEHRDGVRVAVTGAGPGAFRWREAEAALAKRFNAGSLAGLEPDASGLNADIHASAEYRANLAGVMARRAVAAIQ